MTNLARFSTLALLLFAVSFLAAQQGEKNLIKSFNTGGKDQLAFELPGPVDVKTWDNTTVRIELKLALPNSNGGTLDELIRLGRYNLVSSLVDDVFTINSPNTARKLTIKGQELKESLSYIVSVPKTALVKVNGQVIIGGESAYILPPGGKQK